MQAKGSAAPKPAVLLVNDDRGFVDLASRLLRDAFDIRPISDRGSALAELASRTYKAVLLSINLEDEPGGLEVVHRMRRIDSQVPIFVVAGSDRSDDALEAGKLGADKYFARGSSGEGLIYRIRSALKSHLADVQGEPVERGSDGRHGQFVGQSEAVRRLMADAETVARVDSTVLLTGENGTGKEVLAHYIHRRSPRAGRAFITVNCAAIPEGLVESELFGHERGAFTGATNPRRGSFELADGGTLLLDEITEMPPALQPKLLRALQSGEFSRVGSEKSQSADARVICSSNRELSKAVARGKLRQDLYYRINVVSLSIPPLRERREDIPVLARHFLRGKAAELGKRVKSISQEAQALLLAHDWPGNARELENLIERAVVFCRSSTIGPELLSPISPGAAFLSLSWDKARGLVLRRFERSYLTAILEVHAGSVSQASRAMGISRQAFYKALERTGLNASAFRSPARPIEYSAPVRLR